MIKINKHNFIKQRKVLKLSALFLLTVLTLPACKKDKTDLGDTLQDQSLNHSALDTFTLLTYTEEIDSMPTDETTVSMLGAYNDPVFGGVDCGFVTQLRLSSSNPGLGTSATTVVDSVVLALRFTSINYYANIQDITVEVYEISDDLVRTDQEYYAFSEPTTTGGNLVVPGTETFTPDFVKDVVVGGDTLSPQVRIQLEPSLGMQMVALNEGGSMATDDVFINAFKGLYVKVSMPSLATGQGMVVYFSLESVFSEMVMYFHTDTDPTIQEFPFLINTNAARYNKITFDRSGTEVQTAIDNPTTYTEKFFMQGSSLRGVIEFPHLMDLNYDENGEYKPRIINQAKLILPIQDYQPDPFDPSTSLFLARIVDDKLSTFTLDYFGQTVNTVNYDEDLKAFTFIMTREIQNVLNETIENKGYRVYSPSFFGSTIERVIFNGSGTSLKDKPRLEISFTEY